MQEASPAPAPTLIEPPAPPPPPSPVRLHERPRLVDADIVPPAPELPPLPPAVPDGSPGEAVVRVTGAWTAAFTVTDDQEHLVCRTQQWAESSPAAHQYYAATRVGPGGTSGEFGLERGDIGLQVTRSYSYTVPGRLTGESATTTVHWSTDDKRASQFQSFETAPRYRFSEDRRRVAFAIAGYVGPKSAYDRHQEIGEVAISGTISCPGPVEPVAQRLPAGRPEPGTIARPGPVSPDSQDPLPRRVGTTRPVCSVASAPPCRGGPSGVRAPAQLAGVRGCASTGHVVA